jgi:hypothetical protein
VLNAILLGYWYVVVAIVMAGFFYAGLILACNQREMALRRFAKQSAILLSAAHAASTGRVIVVLAITLVAAGVLTLVYCHGPFPNQR